MTDLRPYFAALGLPEPEASWPWPVAPFGELDPAYQALHRVVAIRL